MSHRPTTSVPDGQLLLGTCLNHRLKAKVTMRRTPLMPEVPNMPAGLLPGMGGPSPMFYQQNQIPMGVPYGRQRKLALQPFDRKELYHGLGSGFIEWGKEFMRQVNFSERACGFVWPGDINVDMLGQHLAVRRRNNTADRWKHGGLEAKPWSMRCKLYCKHLR